MSQEMKIGVSADTGAAESAVKNIDRAAEGAAQSVGDISSAAKDAIGNLTRMEEVARRLKSTQDILSREFGRPISAGDAQTALGNFDKMRSSRGVGRRMLRGFNDFESWYLGHSTAYRRPQDAEAHRRFVMAQTMQGTSDASDHGAPPAGGDGGGGGGGPHSPNSFDRGMRKSQSMALGFGKSMLALAGINSIMGMAGQAVDLGTEESVGTDTLKRRMGDLGVDFDRLRDQARGAGAGLGVTFVEANRLGQQFARVAGNLTSRDLDGQGFQRQLRTGIGFGRSFGLDPSEGVQFFGTMRRLGVAGDDQSSRKLGLTIADAIQKGGYGGKADEVLAAIADFSTQVSRITLTAPNVTAFAGAMSSMTGMGYAGLDPAAAAAILGQADAATRRGGAYGQASTNFSYSSLYRGMPGLNPVTAEGVLSGGLFGTTRQTFAKGTPLGDFYRTNGLAMPGMSDTTNFERQMGLMRQSYGNTPWLLDAMKNHFGLQSVQQAAVLAQMKPDSLHDMVGMLGHAGLGIGDVKDSAYAGLAAIAGAGGPADLGKIYKSTRNRTDISASEREALDKAAGSGNPEALKDALVKVVGTHEQVSTEGTRTRDSIAELKNELTRVGAELLAPLNLIRQGVVAMAEHFAPGTFTNPRLGPQDVGGDLVKPYRMSQLQDIKKQVERVSSLDPYFAAAEKKTGVDRRLLKMRGVMESGLRQTPGLKTRFGQAYGIMQVTPETAAQFGFSEADLHDPAKNIMAGAMIYADKLAKGKGDKGKAAALYYGGSAKGIGANATQYAMNDAMARGVVLGDHYQPPAGMPLPPGDPESKSASGAAGLNVKISDANVTIMDERGRERGAVILKAQASPTPAGVK